MKKTKFDQREDSKTYYFMLFINMFIEYRVRVYLFYFGSETCFLVLFLSFSLSAWILNKENVICLTARCFSTVIYLTFFFLFLDTLFFVNSDKAISPVTMLLPFFPFISIWWSTSSMSTFLPLLLSLLLEWFTGEDPCYFSLTVSVSVCWQYIFQRIIRQ